MAFLSHTALVVAKLRPEPLLSTAMSASPWHMGMAQQLWTGPASHTGFLNPYPQFLLSSTFFPYSTPAFSSPSTTSFLLNPPSTSWSKQPGYQNR